MRVGANVTSRVSPNRMQTETYVTIGLTLAGLVVGAGTTLFLGGWQLGRLFRHSENGLRQLIVQAEERLEDKITISDGGTTQSLLQLRQHIHDNEIAQLKALQDYVRRDTFQLVIGEIKENTALAVAGVGKDVEKLDLKIDRLIDYLIPKPKAL